MVGPSPGVQAAEQPGFLRLPLDKEQQLISDQPLEASFHVEEEPFARGKFAAVRRCIDRHSKKTFAAKFLKKGRGGTLRPEILHEVAVLEACSSCPRIAKLERVFESDAEMVLLLEMVSGGELQSLLDRDEMLEERDVARLMRQILEGIAFLHSINVAHLDIKPQNLVLTGEWPTCDVKLCDLGISRYVGQGADVREILGTPDYVAPEVLNYEPISLATDMWSVGVLLYAVLTGYSPFGGDTKQETFCNIAHCQVDFPEDLFEDVSLEAQDLIAKLLVRDPSKRLSASECLEHRWFSVFTPVPCEPLCEPPPLPSSSPPPLPDTPPPLPSSAPPDAVYRVRRCFVLDECDDSATSDSVSDMSIDSDSVVSLDEEPCSWDNARLFRQQLLQQARSPAGVRQPGAFARARSVFSGGDAHAQMRTRVELSREGSVVVMRERQDGGAWRVSRMEPIESRMRRLAIA
ncbi:serine/threonine-protein kinase 17A-like [Neocloeon triangulifer]|uniref:serine/threonine-protein kinase 17A-like n=1 Tax=Neocloeon triangulifer TaxID=2078957 RepID=UPI00286F3CE2|nr:serine/threonine-protein kinase 17A-like [Neocloeon triangulifer]